MTSKVKSHCYKLLQSIVKVTILIFCYLSDICQATETKVVFTSIAYTQFSSTTSIGLKINYVNLLNMTNTFFCTAHYELLLVNGYTGLNSSQVYTYSNTGSIISSIYIDSLGKILTSKDNLYQYHNVQTNDGGVTFVIPLVAALSHADARSSYSIPNTSYIVQTEQYKVTKYDASANQDVPGMNRTLTNEHWYIYTEPDYQNDNTVWLPSYKVELNLLRHTDFTILKNLSFAAGSGTRYYFGMLIDNLNTSHAYFIKSVYTTIRSNFAYKADISGTSMSDLTESSSSGIFILRLANCGPFYYLINLLNNSDASPYGYERGSSIVIRDKTDLSVGLTLDTLIREEFAGTYGLCAYYNESSKLIHAIGYSDSYKAHKFTLNINRCKDLLSSGICLQCQLGFYRDSIDAGNSCISYDEIPVGKGINISNNVTTDCLDSTCMDCRSDHTKCGGCAAGEYFTIINGKNGACYVESAIPAGYGKNNTEYKLEPCAATGCQSCKDDFKACLGCPANTWYTQSGANITGCYSSSSIPPGYGKQSGQFLLAVCSIAGCGNCIDDITTCITCQSGKYYKESGNKLACYDSTDIPTSWGIVTGQYRIVTCAVQGCSDCKADKNQCLSCSSDRWFNETGNKLNCYLTSEIPAGLGKQVGQNLLTACSVVDCGNCTEFFAECISCLPTTYYTEATGNKLNCYNSSSLPAGYGVNSGMLLSLCTITGCNDCKANYTQCKSCQANRYYKHTGPDVTNCYLETDIPDGYGKNGLSQLLLACQKDGCISCKPDYTTCQECASDRWYVEATENKSTCYTAATSPSGYGKRAGFQLLYSCSFPGCANCIEDYNICTACPSGNWYTGTSGLPTACYNDSSIAPGLGKKSGEQLLYSCSVAGCSNCKDDYTKCLDCVDGRYYTEASGLIQKCILAIEIPAGYGKDGTNKLIKKCTSLGCSNCLNDYRNCSKCNIDRYFTESTGDKAACYELTSIPFTYGINGSQRLLAPCSNTECKNCSTDYNKCTVCKPSSWYIETTDGKVTCYSAAPLPEGYGLESSAGTKLRPCSLANCGDCFADYQFCTTCALDSWFVDSLVPKTSCFLIDNIPDGYGKKAGDQQLHPCSQADCNSCARDYTKCANCKPTQYYVQGQGYQTCYTDTTIPDGLGKTSNSMLVKPCLDSGCMKCKDDFTKCQLCYSNHTFTEINGVITCHTDNNIPNGFGRKGTQLKLERCVVDNCKICAVNYLICNGCTPGYSLISGQCSSDIPPPPQSVEQYAGEKKGLTSVDFDEIASRLQFKFDMRVKQEELEKMASNIKIMGYIKATTLEEIRFPPNKQSPPVKFNADGFEFSIDLGGYEGEIDLLVENNSGSGYLRKDLKVGGVKYAQKTSSSYVEPSIFSFIFGVAVVAGVCRLVIYVLARPYLQSLSTFLDKVCSTWTLLLLLIGKPTSQTDYYLWLMSRLILFNPFTSKNTNSSCKAEPKLQERNIECNIADSYGCDLFIIYVSLLVCTILQILGKYIKNKPLLKSASVYYGIRLWMRRMYSLCLQVMILVFVNLRYMNTDTMMTSFLVYCGPLILFYTSTLVLLAYKCRTYYTNLKKMIILNRDGKERVMRVADEDILGFLYEGIKITNNYAVVLPLVYILKCIAQAGALIFIMNNGIIQIIVIVSLELAYLYMLLSSDCLMLQAELSLELLVSLQILLIGAGKFASNYTDQHSSTQANLTDMMGLVVIVVGIVAFGRVASTAISLYKKLLERKPPAQLPGPSAQDKPIDDSIPAVYEHKMLARKGEKLMMADLFGKIGYIPRK